MKTHFPILIVGGGFAGLMAAWRFSLQGHSVLVLEARPAVKLKVCGEYLCPPGKDLLVQLGLGDFLTENFLPVYGMRLMSPNGTEVMSTFPFGRSGLSLRRDKLEQKLADLASASGVKILWGTAVHKIQKIQNGYKVITDKGEWTTDFLVGADGRKSLVAKTIGVDINTNKETRVALHVYLKKKKNFLRTGEMHIFADGAYAGINPVEKELVNFSIVTDKKNMKLFKNSIEIIEYYRAQSPVLRDEYEPFTSTLNVTSVYPLTHPVKKFVGERVALIGDAGGFIDPLTGEGIYLALWSGYHLSLCVNSLEQEKLKQALFLYSEIKNKKFKSKVGLNTFFQWFIRQPKLCNALGAFLQQKKSRADDFIGIIGNIFTPFEGGIRLFISLFK